MYGGFLRQVVYEDRVKLEDFELVKLSKYYAAHVILITIFRKNIYSHLTGMILSNIKSNGDSKGILNSLILYETFIFFNSNILI